MIIVNGKKYTRAELKRLRNIVEGAIHSVDDDTALEGTTLFPLWSELVAQQKEFTEEDVANGFRFQHNDVLYRVLQSHTVQENWTPEDSSSLYTKVLIPDSNVIYEWEQPESTNGYKYGDVVSHNGKIWESFADNNIWEPGVQGTEEVWKEKEVTSE